MSEILRSISKTSLVPPDNQVSAEWVPPTSIEWAPAGQSTISATKGNRPWTGVVITGPEDAARLDAQLQQLLAESNAGKRSRPFIDFDHKGGEAAAIPVKFTWANGIRLLLEWTSAGLAAIAGRTYSYFSPELILGDDNHPEALPAPGSIGSLVNAPAFQRIQRLAAANSEQKDKKHMSALLKAAVLRGYVPTGVEDEDAAADHFIKKVEAAAKAEGENASLKARLGELERKQSEADDVAKQVAANEVDAWIKAGVVMPEARAMVLGNLQAEPDLTRKQYVKAQQQKNAVKAERPVSAAHLGFGDVSEEEDRILREDNPDRRRIMRCEQYTRAQAAHLKASNSIDPALISPIASEAVITKLGVALAPLNAFAKQFTTIPAAPKVPQIVTIVNGTTPGYGVLRNASDFNQSFLNLTPQSVIPAQLTSPWNLANSNIQDGMSMMVAAEMAAQTLAEAILHDVIAVIDATNFPGTQVTDPIANWATAGIQNAFVVVANGRIRNLIVAPEIFAKIMVVDSKSFVLTPSQQGAGAWGFNGIWFHNDWTRTAPLSSVANLRGFVCDPQAIIVTLGPPIIAPGAAQAGLVSSTATAPGAGVTVQSNTWFSTQSRQPCASFDVVLGVAKGDTSAGHLVIAT